VLNDSVAEPEPMERQLLLKPEPNFFGPDPEPGTMSILIKCYTNPKFFLLKFIVDF
jgi:hypothetical protein